VFAEQKFAELAPSAHVVPSPLQLAAAVFQTPSPVFQLNIPVPEKTRKTPVPDSSVLVCSAPLPDAPQVPLDCNTPFRYRADTVCSPVKFRLIRPPVTSQTAVREASAFHAVVINVPEITIVAPA